MKIQMKVLVSSGTQTYQKGAIVELPAYKGEELILKGYATLVVDKVDVSRGGQAESRGPHKAEIVGSTPTPATKIKSKGKKDAGKSK